MMNPFLNVSLFCLQASGQAGGAETKNKSNNVTGSTPSKSAQRKCSACARVCTHKLYIYL